MGLDWGFSLRKRNDKNFNLDLIHFCGWNTKETLAVIFNDFGKIIPEKLIPDDFRKEYETDTKVSYDEFYKEVDLHKLFDWGIKLAAIKDIFANISDRKINEGAFTKKISEQYADLCYDLGIEYDDIIIFSLIKLSNFIDFLISSDLFEEYLTDAKDNYLVVWQNY